MLCNKLTGRPFKPLSPDGPWKRNKKKVISKRQIGFLVFCYVTRDPTVLLNARKTRDHAFTSSFTQDVLRKKYF